MGRIKSDNKIMVELEYERIITVFPSGWRLDFGSDGKYFIPNDVCEIYENINIVLVPQEMAKNLGLI